MNPNRIDDLEAQFKTFPCEQNLLELALHLVYEEYSDKHQQRGLKLLDRVVVQYNSITALQELGIYYSRYGSKEKRKAAIWVLEECVRQTQGHHEIFILGHTLFNGTYGEKEKQRGLDLMHRALRMDKHNDLYLRVVAVVWLSYAPAKKSVKDAIALFEKAIRLTKSPALMKELAKIFEMGTPLMRPCEKCQRKWERRAAEATSCNGSGAN